MPTETPTQKLASLLLGQPLHEWVAAKRTANVSWRHIAADLRLETGGQVDVSGEAIRGWHDDAVAA